MYYFLVLIYLTLSMASFDTALNAYESNNQEVALSTILELIKNDDKNDKFYYLAAKINYSIGDLDNSNVNIVKAIEIKNDDDSYREYQKILEEFKSSIKSAQKTFDNGYIDESISEYKLLIEKFPDSSIPYYYLGLIYLKSSDYKFAVENLNRAADINPYEKEKYNKSILSIAQRLAKAGDNQYRVREFHDALDLYLESVEYYPEFVAVLYRITNVYQQINDYENAKKFAERTLLHDNTHYKAMKTLGDLYYKSGDLEHCLDSYRKSIAVNPKYYKAYYSLAKALNEMGDIEGALDNLVKAVSINSKYDKAYILLGVIYSDNSDYNNAIKNFNKAVAIDNDNYKLYWRLAETYNRFEKYSQAKETAKQSLKIKDNYAGAFFELGYAELFMCNKVAAEDAFQKAKRDKNYRKSAKHYLDNMNQIFAKNCK